MNNYIYSFVINAQIERLPVPTEYGPCVPNISANQFVAHEKTNDGSGSAKVANVRVSLFIFLISNFKSLFNTFYDRVI